MVLSLRRHVFNWRSIFWKVKTRQKYAIFSLSLLPVSFRENAIDMKMHFFFLRLECPLYQSPLVTPCASLKALHRSSGTASHSPCEPTATGEIRWGNDRVLCPSPAVLLCRGPDTEAFFCAADAALGHIWSASGSVRPPGPGWGHLACRGLLRGRWWANQAPVMLN